MSEFKEYFNTIKFKFITENGTMDRKTYLKIYQKTRAEFDKDFKLKKINRAKEFYQNNKSHVVDYTKNYREGHIQHYLQYQKEYQHNYYLTVTKPKKKVK